MEKIDLYWIDDSMSEMCQIMQYVFPLIWDNEFSCKVILFGNAYCNMKSEIGPNENDKKEFKTEQDNLFYVYCQEIDDKKWYEPGETYVNMKHLLPSEPISLISIWENNSDNDCSFKKLSDNWMDEKKLLDIKECKKINEDMSVDNLVKHMNIPDNAVVALDICLLYEDYNRIEKGIPSISMALYNELTKTNTCYPYSSKSSAKNVFETWNNTYCDIYDCDEKIEIYPKNGLTTKRQDTEAKKNLINSLREGLKKQ